MLNLFLKSFNFVNLHIIIKNEFMLLLYNNVFMYMKNISCFSRLKNIYYVHFILRLKYI